jgi:hypothetical protein
MFWKYTHAVKCTALMGIFAVSIFASDAHPKGPENRPFMGRTMRIQTNTHNCFLTLAYPKAEEVFDRAPDNVYNAWEPNKDLLLSVLSLDYEYRGYFWQGVFGDVSFEVKMEKREAGSPPWTTLEALREDLNVGRLPYNQNQRENPPEGRGERQEAEQVDLNGTQWIRQYESSNTDPREHWYYYLPLEEDYALKLHFWLVDNSHRPGLTRSDWHERAEAFAKKLLATVKVRVEPIVEGSGEALQK